MAGNNRSFNSDKKPVDSVIIPLYPKEVYSYLAFMCKFNDCALDCGSVRSEVATALARKFKHVIAVSAEKRNVHNTPRYENVEYVVACPDEFNFAKESIDLLVVTDMNRQINLVKLLQTAHHDLRQHGIIALLCYERPEIDLALDSALKQFHNEVLKCFFPLSTEKMWFDIEKHFPLYEEIHAPIFWSSIYWNFENLVTYINTWPAVQNFIDINNQSPLFEIINDLREKWGSETETKIINWRLKLQILKKL